MSVSNRKFPIQLLNTTTQLAPRCPMWQWLEVRGLKRPPLYPAISAKQSEGAVKTGEGARHTLVSMWSGHCCHCAIAAASHSLDHFPTSWRQKARCWICMYVHCCVQFLNLCNLHNALHDLARVRLRLSWVGIGVSVSFRWEICKLRMCDFEIAQRILQTAQIDKSCTDSQHIQEEIGQMCRENDFAGNIFATVGSKPWYVTSLPIRS